MYLVSVQFSAKSSTNLTQTKENKNLHLSTYICLLRWVTSIHLKMGYKPLKVCNKIKVHLYY